MCKATHSMANNLQLEDDVSDLICSHHLALPLSTHLAETVLKEAKTVRATDRQEELQSAFAMTWSLDVFAIGEKITCEPDKALCAICPAIGKPALLSKTVKEMAANSHNNARKTTLNNLKEEHFRNVRSEAKCKQLEEGGHNDEVFNKHHKNRDIAHTGVVTGKVQCGSLFVATHMNDIDMESEERGVLSMHLVEHPDEKKEARK